MTEQLYILGHPVAHSKSPEMYNAVYAALGLPWRYGRMDLAAEDEAEAFLHARGFLSVNVTTPWKPLAFRAADVRAATAQLAQGANLLVRADGKLLAYNVDGRGCIDYLLREGVSIAGAAVAICGTGPTALSILNECVQMGAAEVLLLGRDRNRAQAVVNGYLDRYRELLSTAVMLPGAVAGRLSFDEAYERAQLRFGTYASSKRAIAAADLIVDATPLGMAPGDPAPFDTGLISAGQVVLDTVYGHGTSALLHAARAAGAQAFDGRGMLVGQAAATAGIVCDVAGVRLDRAPDELFAMMAEAAGFDI